MRSAIAGLLRLASYAACLIVVASFVIFVVDQTSSASAHQQQEIISGPAQASANSNARSTPKVAEHKGAVHEDIDEASETITTPFTKIVTGSSSEWGPRIAILVLTLLIYGFGLGFLARTIGVRL